MLIDQMAVLDKQAKAADAKGDKMGAATIRVREARVLARLASMPDSGAP